MVQEGAVICMNHFLYQNIHIVSAAAATAGGVCSLTVSTEQPYLKDHDVGLPLFGTVLSLEAMAEARSCFQSAPITRIRNITAGKDCLFSRGSVQELTCYACAEQLELFYKNDLVFRCLMSSSSPLPVQEAITSERSFLRPHCRGASRADIYSSLFHGPSFQVLEHAVACESKIITQLNPDLPPLSEDPDYQTLLPLRWIEFCLQSFGMWELAFADCVSVPLAIAQIDLYTHQMPETGYAIAESQPKGGHILAVSAQGEPVLEVTGYQTRQMPYGENNSQALRAKLLAHESL